MTLGADEKILADHTKSVSEWRKNRWFKKGYKAGKKGLLPKDCPYTLTEEIWTLLRKRAYWLKGCEEGSYRPSSKRLKQEAEMEHRHKHRKKKRYHD